MTVRDHCDVARVDCAIVRQRWTRAAAWAVFIVFVLAALTL